RKRIEHFSAAAVAAGEASSRIHLRPPCHPILLLVLRRGCNSDAARDLHRQFTPPSAVGSYGSGADPAAAGNPGIAESRAPRRR
ncbi:unnamed protein product, partial [Urochloa humidicola]